MHGLLLGVAACACRLRSPCAAWRIVRCSCHSIDLVCLCDGGGHPSLHSCCFRMCPAQRFAAVIMRIREPKTTALIFASGKMVCTGAKSESDSKLAAKKVCVLAGGAACRVQENRGGCRTTQHRSPALVLHPWYPAATPNLLPCVGAVAAVATDDRPHSRLVLQLKCDTGC